jgi:hypothetical protein
MSSSISDRIFELAVGQQFRPRDRRYRHAVFTVRWIDRAEGNAGVDRTSSRRKQRIALRRLCDPKLYTRLDA